MPHPRRVPRRRALALAALAPALMACAAWERSGTAAAPAPADRPRGQVADAGHPTPEWRPGWSGSASGATSPGVTPGPATPLPSVKVACLWAVDGGADPFWRPTGLALGPGGEIYVADAGHHRVVVLDADGRFVRAWGGEGDDAGRLRLRRPDICADGDPSDCEPDLGGALAVAADGVVYVADYANHRLQAVDPAGRPLAAWGGAGDGPGQFRLPRGVAINAAGRVCVSDSDNHRVQVFDRAGRFLAAWGRKGVAPDAFLRPGAVAADARGVLYVADLWNGRVCRRDPAGRPLPEWPTAADVQLAAVAVSRPSGLALDADGNLYLTGGGPSVQQFDAHGRPRLRWRADWRGEARLERPAGVAVDGRGDVYVADAGANRVVKFRILAPTDR